MSEVTDKVEVKRQKEKEHRMIVGAIIGVPVMIVWTLCLVMLGWAIYVWDWSYVHRAIGLFVMSLPAAIISYNLMDV